MQTTFYFIRHGEVKNPTNVWYGRLPRYGLTERGKTEIEQTANFLINKNITAIYASPLFRAKQTAKIIANKLNITPIHYSDDLLEVKSSLEGKPFSYMQPIHFNIYPSQGTSVVGETIADVTKRLQNFMSRVAKMYQGKHIVAVTHGDLLMIIKALGEQLPLELSSLRPEPGLYAGHGEVYTITYEAEKITSFHSLFKPEELSR